MRKNQRNNLFKFTCFTMFLINSAYSQISINYLVPDNSIFKQEDVWKFILINGSGAEQTCSLNIQLVDNSMQEILSISTPNFTLIKGINTNFEYLKQTSEYIFGNNETATNFNTNGYLFDGEYQLCLNIIPVDNKVFHVEKCIIIKAKEYFLLRLQFPPDHSEIVSNHPMLQWASSGQNENIHYALKLAGLEEGQSELEALESNQLLVDESDLYINRLIYPYTAPTLEPNRIYVWQVSAIRDNRIIAVTEPWEFSLKSRDTVELRKSDCYRLIDLHSNNEFYLNDGFLRFEYNNKANDRTLSYKIIDQKNNKECKTELVIPLTYGLNKIDINLRKYSKLKINRRHLLEIRDSDNNIYRLVFTMLAR